MTSPIKKTTFEDLQTTLSTISNKVDGLLREAKEKNRGNKVYEGHPSFREFLKDVERKALKEAGSELGMADTTIRDRWRILTLPLPVFAAIESGDITFSKAKPLTSINFDFDSEEDAAIVARIVEKIKDGMPAKEVKELVKEEGAKIWHGSDIVIKRLAEQNGISEETVC